jgi:hypothetical protein
MTQETQFQKDCKDPAYCAWANCHCAYRKKVIELRTKLKALDLFIAKCNNDPDKPNQDSQRVRIGNKFVKLFGKELLKSSVANEKKAEP